MSLFSGNAVNMDGSEDPCYRYKMPALWVKQEGSSKMKKSVIINITDVSRAVGRPKELILSYLGQSVSAASKIEKDTGKAYVAGHHGSELLQQQVITFIRDMIMCRHCNNPETSCHAEGNKKKLRTFLLCKSCGKCTDLDSSDRFVKHMAQHLPNDKPKGHADASVAMAEAAELADSEAATRAEDKSKKRQICPNPICGHKTAKPICSKCGTAMAAEKHEPDAQSMDEGGHYEHVRSWMDQHDMHAPEDLHEKFHKSMQVHGLGGNLVGQLGAIMSVLAAQAVAEHDLTERKLQPVTVAEKVTPLILKWNLLIDGLYGKLADKQAEMDMLISALQEASSDLPNCGARDSIVIGFLLSLQGAIDSVTDEDLLSGCRRQQTRSLAMEKFIEFIASDGESGEDSDEE